MRFFAPDNIAAELTAAAVPGPLAAAAALLVRFFRSGGRAMLKMMGGSPDGHH